ncbi:cell division protein SepF [Goodfellowiella coeruleoviolacea]|nr:cell division protein SepF [Goodfellowiella coeruleoviolacea]
MSALQKLKAYFGMVPAEDLDGYEDDNGRYADDYRGEYRGDYAADGADYSAYPERGAGRRRRSDYRADLAADAEDYDPEARGRARRAWNEDAPVRGALAVDPARDAVTRLRPVQEPNNYPLGRIIHLHPRSYHEARTIGEHYRDGTPVIMNLTGMDDADARRLVDFAAGLAFALRGAMDKITNKVFLISPPNIDVTAEDRRRLAEGGFLNHG